MEGFNFVMPIEVRFRDLDAMGHVNNAVYMTYLETARIKLMMELTGARTLGELGTILAEITCSYRSPAFYGEVLNVGVRIAEIGNKSFVMEYRIEEQKSGRLVATARSVQVSYDHRAQQAVPLSTHFIERAEAHEGRPLRRRER
jgi:acyl-CoA thioester hydrolase